MLNCAVYEIVLKFFVHPDRPQMTIWFKRNARWINKATKTQSEYVTGLLIDFPLQLFSSERTSILRYTFIVCLVIFLCASVGAITVHTEGYLKFHSKGIHIFHNAFVAILY